jgi:serine/threonine protein kinase
MGVCHRDLSLENVLVDEQNCVIIDMGMCLRIPYDNGTSESEIVDVIAGKRRRLMKPQGVCGKHNYMSPEVYNNVDNFDGFAIDLWAAGVILYIMLTGFPPYDQASLTDERFKLIIHGQLVQQLNHWDIFPSAEAGDLLQRMLRLHPRDRLTLAQIMSHPWVTNKNVQGPPVNRPKFSY